MIYKTLPLPTIELIENGKERYYRDPNGTRFISVTQLLKDHFAKPFLDEWKERVGEEESNYISAVAKTRGHVIHSAIQEYLDYYDIVPWNMLQMPFNREMFFKFKKPIDEHLSEVHGIEQPLVSYKYNIAGTTDLIGVWDGLDSIIDHKTSKYEKHISEIEDYFVQKTIYSIMIEECIGIEYKQLVCLMGVDHSNEAQIHIQTREQYESKAMEVLRAVR